MFLHSPLLFSTYLCDSFFPSRHWILLHWLNSVDANYLSPSVAMTRIYAYCSIPRRFLICRVALWKASRKKFIIMLKIYYYLFIINLLLRERERGLLHMYLFDPNHPKINVSNEISRFLASLKPTIKWHTVDTGDRKDGGGSTADRKWDRDRRVSRASRACNICVCVSSA